MQLVGSRGVSATQVPSGDFSTFAFLPPPVAPVVIAIRLTGTNIEARSLGMRKPLLFVNHKTTTSNSILVHSEAPSNAEVYLLHLGKKKIAVIPE